MVDSNKETIFLIIGQIEDKKLKRIKANKEKRDKLAKIRMTYTSKTNAITKDIDNLEKACIQICGKNHFLAYRKEFLGKKKAKKNEVIKNENTKQPVDNQDQQNNQEDVQSGQEMS